jgi:hypothetical protein
MLDDLNYHLSLLLSSGCSFLFFLVGDGRAEAKKQRAGILFNKGVILGLVANNLSSRIHVVFCTKHITYLYT